MGGRGDVVAEGMWGRGHAGDVVMKGVSTVGDVMIGEYLSEGRRGRVVGGYVGDVMRQG